MMYSPYRPVSFIRSIEFTGTYIAANFAGQNLFGHHVNTALNVRINPHLHGAIRRLKAGRWLWVDSKLSIVSGERFTGTKNIPQAGKHQ
jgi:hypothetical protein